MSTRLRLHRSASESSKLFTVDLNVPLPPVEYLDQVGMTVPTGPVVAPNVQQGGSVSIAPIDLEEVGDDDEVMISSPRAFAEARNNPRRRTRESAILVDVDTGESSWVAPTGCSKQRRISGSQTDRDLQFNSEGSTNTVYVSARVLSLTLPPQPLPPPPPPPQEPTFTCPICMGALVEEMSTKCGHIFCKECIMTALAAQAKCPTCRGKITKRTTIRVYLPTTN